MTATTPGTRTQSFDEAQDEPASSNLVSTRSASREVSSELGQVVATELSEIGLGLEQALRAARTPLIAGVDYHTPEAPPDGALADGAQAEAGSLEKSRVDTLSPLESVPPPAPFPAEPPPARPSVVPPVRLPHSDQQPPRARPEPYGSGIRSDPPPRIPISDRPSRRAYSSAPPPRLSRSDPPQPQSSRRGTDSQRRSWDAAECVPPEGFVDSFDARRREAATVPADAHSPVNALAYDPSMPLPALRAPSFSANHLPHSVRQHENSRLRHVAMAMMFVIFIVTGAIAGMRWYVTRTDEDRSTDTVAESPEPRAPRVKLDRLEPNATVAPRRPAATADPRGSQTQPPKNDVDGATADTSKTLAASAGPPDKTAPSDTTSKPPTAQSASPRSGRKAKRGVSDPNKIDTKTPLIMD